MLLFLTLIFFKFHSFTWIQNYNSYNLQTSYNFINNKCYGSFNDFNSAGEFISFFDCLEKGKFNFTDSAYRRVWITEISGQTQSIRFIPGNKCRVEFRPDEYRYLEDMSVEDCFKLSWFYPFYLKNQSVFSGGSIQIAPKL